MKAIQNIIRGVLIVASASSAFAQSPTWTMDASKYQYSMTVVAFLNVDGSTLQNTNDKVAAFVGSEIRGSANLMLAKSADRHLAYLTIFANRENEEVTFKVYNSATSKVTDIDTKVVFKIDAQRGNVFQAYSIAKPALSAAADFEAFFFSDADTIGTEVKDHEVKVMVEYDQPLTTLTPDFIASTGAKVYIGREHQLPGAAALDFSEPLVYSVLSQDESNLKEYAVSVVNRATTGEGFVSTNVITLNNDGLNDTWVVQDVFIYKDYRFRIFDANGRILHESIGYQNDWNGEYKGKKLERGKYYFSVLKQDTGEVINGEILVLY